MRLDYKILEKSDLVLEVLHGNIALRDYLQFKGKLMSDHPQASESNFIIDLRDVVIESSGKELEGVIRNYLESVEHIPGIIEKRKSALLTKTPDQVIATTMYKILNNLPVEVEIFTTVSAAINWLDLKDLDSDDIQKMLSDMKEQ